MKTWRVVAAAYMAERINEIVEWYEDNRSDELADKVRNALFRGFATLSQNPEGNPLSSRYLPGTFHRVRVGTEEHTIYYHIDRKKMEVLIYLILGKGQDAPRPIEHKRTVKGAKDDAYEVKPRTG